MSAWVLLNVWSSNEWYDGVDFAVIELTPEYVALILKRAQALKAAKEEDKDLYNSRYWDYSPNWYVLGHPEQQDDDTRDFLDGSQQDEFWIRQHKPEVSEETLARVECPCMIVDENSVWWTTYPKHVDGTRLNTAAIPISDLEAVAKETT